MRLEEDQHFIADLIGCKVVDSKGCEVGVLREVLQPGANDVTGDGKSILSYHSSNPFSIPSYNP